jgi:hypothetical protein
MRRIKLWIWSASICAGALVWHSCGEPIPSIELEQFLYLSLIGAKEVPAIKRLDLASTADTTFYITMAYGGTTNYEQGDISATLDKDVSLVATFNAANNTEYRLLPEEVYSFDRTDLRISNGKNASEPVKLTLRMKAINLSYDYLLPVTVTSVSGTLPLKEELKTLYLVFQGDIDEDKDKNRWRSTGASSEEGAYTAALAFDDNRNTYWHSATGSGMPQWFTVNMQGFKRISGFTWVHRTDPVQLAIPKHVKFETSVNGTEWTEVLNVPEVGQSRVLQVFPLGRTLVAKHFRVTVLSNWADAPYTYVGEVDIFSGNAPEPEYDWEKHTWEIVDFSSFWIAPWGVQYAIDGDKNTHWHSDVSGGMPQWLVIDLKKSRTIRGILLWNSQLSFDSPPKNIVFEVSDDQTNWTTLLDEPEMSPDHDRELNLPAPSPQAGRYLRVTVKSNWVDFPWTYIGEITLY